MTDNLEELERQIDRLANFIMHKIEGEPSQSQGAVDTAIRIMDDQAREVEGLRERNDALALQADEWEGKYAAVSEINEGLREEVARLTHDNQTFAASVIDFHRVCNANRTHGEVTITGEVTAAFNRLYAHVANLARAALAGKGG